jgi:hypothetical protein
MANLFDDAARILASPMPRRQALKALGRVLTGSLLAAFGVRQAESQAANPEVRSTCRPACSPDQKCCPGYGIAAFCVGASRICCGDKSCAAGASCCTDTRGQKFCSGVGRTCCGNTSCVTAEQKCCTTGSQPFCLARADKCCGNTACGPLQTCCNNTVCCSASQRCVDGRCQSSRV